MSVPAIARSVLPLLLLSAVAHGCPRPAAPAPPAPPELTSDNPQAEREFKAARGLFEGELWEFAARAFGQFLVDHPDDPLARAAALYLARIALERGDPALARELLKPALGAPGSLGDRAALYDGVALKRLGRHLEAVQILERLRGRMTGTEDNLALLDSLWRAHLAAGDPERAVIRIDELLASRPADREPEAEPAMALIGIVEDIENIEPLERLAGELPARGLAWSVVQAGLAGRRFEAGDLAGAAAAVAAIRAAGGPRHPAVEEIVDLVERRSAVDLGSIGCILPLSGRSRLVGEAVLKGVMLGAKVLLFGAERRPLEVVIRDTGGDPDAAAKAVEQLVLEDHVAAIVGPVEGEEAAAAARRAEELGVPMLALTMRVDVPAAGPYVFREFSSGEAEIRALLDSARRLGLGSFAVMHPNDAYGRGLQRAFAAELERRGERLVKVVEYDAGTTDFREPVAVLAEASFDALFLPDRAARVALLAPALAAAGLWSSIPGEAAPGPGRAVTLLVPSAGVAADLPRRAGRYLSGALFAAGFHEDAGPGPARFAAGFRDEYRAEPSAFAAFGHDAALLAAGAISAGARSRPAIRRWLEEADASVLAKLPLAAPFDGFDETGDARSGALILMLRGDRFEVFE